jgi:hypothetical protein
MELPTLQMVLPVASKTKPTGFGWPAKAGRAEQDLQTI